jgi:hypothetical protein
MKPANASAMPLDMEQARQELEAWRSTHRPRCHIPDSLWKRAARSIQAQAVTMVMGLAHTRWLMYEQGANSVSKPMLVILVFWLSAIFVSFGLFAPRNATAITALFVAGLSVSGAIFLILELYAPFGGVIEISSGPLRATLSQLGH